MSGNNIVTFCRPRSTKLPRIPTDLVNLLLELFHRWARVVGLGQEVNRRRIPSVSFADNVILLLGSRQEQMAGDAVTTWPTFKLRCVVVGAD